ncbi:MAG: type II toxin-antitoxin system RelE/ParE family toxin [Limisphaerales bacterium]
MPEYILDPCVEDELWGIWCFIAQDNPNAATHVIEAAYETFKTLAANPGLGKLRRFRSPKLREVRSWRISGYENYLIFYRGIADGIQVNHVYHGARDIEALFGEKCTQKDADRRPFPPTESG